MAWQVASQPGLLLLCGSQGHHGLGYAIRLSRPDQANDPTASSIKAQPATASISNRYGTSLL